MGDFMTNLSNALSRRGIKLSDFCDTSDPFQKRMLQEYGAVFLANDRLKFTGWKPFDLGFTIPFTDIDKINLPTFAIDRVEIPPQCILDDAGVTAFQSKLKTSKATVGGTTITLQEAAMGALLEAEKEIKAAGLTLTPRGGSTGASRTFGNTREFWDNNLRGGLAHWKGQTKGGVKFDEASKNLMSLPLKDQIKKVMELESKGFFFSKDFKKTILQSVAAPGTSQHLWLLALDIKEHADNRVSKILAKWGWYQTIKSDLPHFTYLGFVESQLSSLGLKKESASGQEFWVPDL